MTTFGDLQGSATVMIPGSASGFAIDWAAATDVGLRRAVNEDSLVASPPVFAVADGMGGHSAGDVASAAVVRRLFDVGVSGEATPLSIERALSDAQSDLDEVRAQSALGSGTTVTGVAIVESDGKPAWLVFNIGDSRVYAMTGGDLVQVTSDHSVVQEMLRAGLITPDQAESHPDSNIITRAVGFEDRPVPDYVVVPIIAGQRILICSDGLTKELDRDRLASLTASDGPLPTVVDGLITSALDNGGRDNVTAIALHVNPA